MESSSASGDGSEPPVVRLSSTSRPPSPSPSLVPGFLNLDVVDEKLRQRTLSPETPSAEKECLKARKPFDELVELGGIPLRPWVDYRAEELTDAQRGDDNGEEWMQCRYMDERLYWQSQLRLWSRFAKRRSQDSESSLRTLDPIAAVTAFTTYLRNHLRRDMEDREKPGCDLWSNYFNMEWHREFIELVVENLPVADALLRQLKVKGRDSSVPEVAEVTREGLIEEYNIPRQELWDKLWDHTQASLAESEAESLLPTKRQRDDADDADENGDEENARPTKRMAPSAKLSAGTDGLSSQESQKRFKPSIGSPGGS